MRPYVVEYEERRIFVMAASPKKAAQRMGNRVLPDTIRWGDAVKVYSLKNGKYLKFNEGSSRSFFVFTERVVTKVECY